MKEGPLAPPPPNSDVADLFLRHFRVARRASGGELLESVAQAFARIPYENLTKIIKHAGIGNAERARRSPLEVVREHVLHGTGGTCFSLTASLLHILRTLGWRAEPILGDRKYGSDTHCALLVWIDGEPHLVDPGYLIVKPLPLISKGELKVENTFNELVLHPREGGEKLDLYTVQQGNKTYRLTFKTPPADSGQFLKAWDASFDWDMMRYPLLTSIVGDRQLYLQGNRFQVRALDGVSRSEVPADELTMRVAREFGIEASIVARALEVLRRR